MAAASSRPRTCARHLSVLGAMVLLLLAWSYRLDGFDLLQRGSGPDGLFLRIDHVVLAAMDRSVLVVMCAIAAPISPARRLDGPASTRVRHADRCPGGRAGRPAHAADPAVAQRARRRSRAAGSRRMSPRARWSVGAPTMSTASARRRRSRSAVPRTAVRTRITMSDLASNVSLWDPRAARAAWRRGAQRACSTPAPPDGRATADAAIRSAARAPPGGRCGPLDRAVADVTAPLLRDSVLDIAVGLRGDERDDAGEPIAAPGATRTSCHRDPAGVLAARRCAASGCASRRRGRRATPRCSTPTPDEGRARDSSRIAMCGNASRGSRRSLRRARTFSRSCTRARLYWALELYSASDALSAQPALDSSPARSAAISGSRPPPSSMQRPAASASCLSSGPIRSRGPGLIAFPASW